MPISTVSNGESGSSVRTKINSVIAEVNALGTAADLNVGTTAGTVCAGDDSRLSDSREWTASTISQAEAEAGTSTTRRAFTAERVFQAIAAWWATITASALRSKAELGDSATRNVGTTGGTVCAGDDSRLSNSRTPTAHAASHINGTDDIQNATAAQKGLMTAAYASKLDGIEALADVTDAANIGAAISGAATETTLADTDELAYVTSGGTLKNIAYSAVKTLLNALYAIRGAVTGSGLTMATARLLGRSTASTGAVEEISIGSGLSLAAGVLSATGGSGGLVLQVVQTTLTTTATVTGSTFGEVMTRSITPASTSSRILVLAQLSCGNAANNFPYIRLTRGGSVIFQGDSAGSRTRITAAQGSNQVGGITTIPVMFVDSPASTSAQTYAIEIASHSTGAVHLNRSGTDSDAATFARAASSLILVELAS